MPIAASLKVHLYVPTLRMANRKILPEVLMQVHRIVLEVARTCTDMKSIHQKAFGRVYRNKSLIDTKGNPVAKSQTGMAAIIRHNGWLHDIEAIWEEERTKAAILQSKEELAEIREEAQLPAVPSDPGSHYRQGMEKTATNFADWCMKQDAGNLLANAKDIESLARVFEGVLGGKNKKKEEPQMNVFMGGFGEALPPKKATAKVVPPQEVSLKGA